MAYKWGWSSATYVRPSAWFSKYTHLNDAHKKDQPPDLQSLLHRKMQPNFSGQIHHHDF